jgi:hypothetical protein
VAQTLKELTGSEQMDGGDPRLLAPLNEWLKKERTRGRRADGRAEPHGSLRRLW